MELFKEFHDNLSFKKWLSDKGFGIKHMPSAGYKKEFSIHRQNRNLAWLLINLIKREIIKKNSVA